MNSPTRVFVVIPAYNEVQTIRSIAAGALDYVSDVIVVDDGSSDETVAALNGLRVSVHRHDKNLGKAAAIASGFRAAFSSGASDVITIDGDGQHPPSLIPRFLEARDRHQGQLLIGNRLDQKEKFPTHRYLSIVFADYWISKAARRKIRDTQCGIRLYSKELYDLVAQHLPTNNKFTFESEVLIEAARNGFEIIPIDVPAIYFGGDGRNSHIQPGRDVTRTVVMVTKKILFPKSARPAAPKRLQDDSDG